MKWLVMFCVWLLPQTLWGQASCSVQDSIQHASEAQSLLQLEQNRGFPFAVVRLQCQDSVTLVVERGEAWVWAPVRRLNPGKTKDDLLMRMSLLRKGMPAKMGDLERARKLLARSGWFSSVTPARLFRVANRNQLIPAFQVEELNSNQAEGWFSYQNDPQDSAESPWQGRVSVSLENIAGTGRSLWVEGESGSQVRSASFTYREPYPFQVPFVFQFDGGMWNQDSTQERVWGDFGAQWQLDFEWGAEVFAGFATSRETGEKASSKWGSVAIARDGRDRLPLARSGWLWFLELKGGSRSTQDSLLENFLDAFAKSSSRLGIWIPLWRNLGIVNQGEAEALWPRTAQFLEPELIALGGERLPGFWPGSIKTDAFALWHTGLQWTWRDSRALVFVEGARIRNLAQVARWDLKSSFGFGWEQQTSGVGIGLRLAWNEDSKPLEALLSLSVKTRF
jgi:hypothetical protein